MDDAEAPATKVPRVEKQSMDSSAKLTEPEASAPAGHARDATNQKALDPSSQHGSGTVQSDMNDGSTNPIPRIPIIAVSRPTAIMAIFLILIMWFAVGYFIGRRVGLCSTRRPSIPTVKFAENMDPETAAPRDTRLSDVQPEHAIA